MSIVISLSRTQTHTHTFAALTLIALYVEELKSDVVAHERTSTLLNTEGKFNKTNWICWRCLGARTCRAHKICNECNNVVISFQRVYSCFVFARLYTAFANCVPFIYLVCALCLLMMIDISSTQTQVGQLGIWIVFFQQNFILLPFRHISCTFIRIFQCFPSQSVFTVAFSRFSAPAIASINSKQTSIALSHACCHNVNAIVVVHWLD